MLFCFWRPIDFQFFFCASNSCIENVMGNEFFDFIRNHNLYRTILKALSLMDRHCICHLKWNNGCGRIIVIICAAVLINPETNDRIAFILQAKKFKVVVLCIPFVYRNI